VHLIWLLAFGVAIGTISGVLGIGGGVLLIPGLMLLFGFTQPEAQGTSLAAMIPPIGLFAAVVYYRAGHVQLPVAGMIALGFSLGAYFGASLLPYVPLAVLRIGFGVLLIYVGFSFVLWSGGKSAAALPAGVATLISTAIGLLLRRKKPSAASSPPEYHI
jgi:uncharacterized membrane protein YfcA